MLPNIHQPQAGFKFPLFLFWTRHHQRSQYHSLPLVSGAAIQFLPFLERPLTTKELQPCITKSLVKDGTWRPQRTIGPTGRETSHCCRGRISFRRIQWIIAKTLHQLANAICILCCRRRSRFRSMAPARSRQTTMVKCWKSGSLSALRRRRHQVLSLPTG